MKTKEDALLLGKAMVDIGRSFGRNVRALITNMNVPLGYCVGNRLEVYEAVSVLTGKGDEKLTEICVELATNMVSLAKNIDTGSAKALVLDAISSGKAMDKMKEWISHQGGNISYLDNPSKLLCATQKKEYVAKRDGYISKINAEGVGKASMHLGAGRITLDTHIDFSAGIMLQKSYGDYVKAGDTIALMYSSKAELFSSCEDELDMSIDISDKKPLEENLIYRII